MRAKMVRSKDVHVLGIDPGFASVGCTVFQLTGEAEVPVLMEVIRTAKSSAKRNVRASDDNLDRAREIAAEFQRVISVYDIRLICAETMSYPRNAAAAAKMAMCWGVIAAIAYQHSIPVVQASPQEVKKALCGKKDASKEEVQEAVRQRYPALRIEGTETPPLLRGTPRSLWEHPFDAAAAVVACRESEVFLLARRMVAASEA